MAITDDQANVGRRLATLLVVLALLAPLVRNNDGLPLSTYPMYAGTRGEVLELVVAYGIAPDGSEIELTMPEIADTRDPLIAQSFLNDVVASGAGGELCAQIAARSGDKAAFVEVATEVRNVIDHATGQPSLVERIVLARCSR